VAAINGELLVHFSEMTQLIKDFLPEAKSILIPVDLLAVDSLPTTATSNPTTVDTTTIG
jgi:hypothetical protein